MQLCVQDNFWSSLQQTASDYSARNGDDAHTIHHETGEHLETLRFAKKGKDRGGRKANTSKRRVTFADH